uniref:Uncharacterized protein n=1 Tax=Globisporangium ultimum (strain ATCC 200006 / CBS 805.95 / DAOM BR144) TaxID=431595 RepID=K3WF91_GLOUD
MHVRPNLSRDLMRDIDEADDESDEDRGDSDDDGAPDTKKAVSSQQQKLQKISEDDEAIHEELITDGSKLVKMSENEIRERKKKKNHPLFEGLQKIEEELKQKKAEGEEAQVSWNELHQGMLKRYQQKYPQHGLRVQKDDDYDDEFKELMKKHNIDPDALRREVQENKQ